MKKKRTLICAIFLVLIILVAALSIAYRYAGIGGRIIKVKADENKGFYAEYYLFIPDTLKQSDNHFLLVEGTLARIDKQLLAMIADAHVVLEGKHIQIKDKILLNGFSASASFANRFTALYPEKIAAVAAGGLNGMAILPVENMDGRELIYPVGVSDMMEIAGAEFHRQEFASVPQYYYMGANDENDALQYDDAYSDSEREIVRAVLDDDMSIRWEKCKNIYESQGIHAEFHTYKGIGHETTEETNADIVSFFSKVMNGQ